MNGVTVDTILLFLKLPEDIFFRNLLDAITINNRSFDYSSFVKLILYFSLLSIQEVMISNQLFNSHRYI